jgi:hypothetical protein
MERYFDARLYSANWSSGRVIFRIPKARINSNALERYFCAARAAWLSSTKRHVLLDLSCNTKDAWLTRAGDNPELGLGGEPLGAFRAATKVAPASKRQTVGELRALALTLRAKRETAAAAHARQAKVETVQPSGPSPHMIPSAF